jgi:phosphatidylglycerol:prolipoprotein diacylglycerol transferase
MLTYPQIERVAMQIGPIAVHWYGIMYLLGFALAWWLAALRAEKLKFAFSSETISDFIFYCSVGGILGGRLGYVLFYELSYFLHHPLSILATWNGGMSFHGGIIGLIISLIFFARKVKLPFLTMLDFTAPLAPLGIALGRIGNFINAELLGRVTTASWGMIFPGGGPLPRHPSQLYEALTEGIVLFIAVWLYSAKPRPRGTVSALFFLVYGIARFGCEFFRQPDQHLGFIVFNWLTMGQLLSLPVIIIGIIMLILFRKNSPKRH